MGKYIHEMRTEKMKIEFRTKKRRSKSIMHVVTYTLEVLY